MDSLIDKTTPKAVKLALQRLPKGSGALGKAYDKAIERVEGQKRGFRELAKRVLSWITHANWPLTVLELRHALAVEVGERAVDEDNLPEIDDMVSVCAGLVTVNEESNIIRLVHYTTQEYFAEFWPSWIPNAQTDITMTCLTYLKFDVFAVGSCSTDEELKARHDLNPLYDYVAKNWGYHARAASPQPKDQILSFLGNPALVASCSQAVMTSRRYFAWRSKELPSQVTGMHLVAYSGWEEIMTTLLEHGHDPDPKDSKGRTPLCWAASLGNEMVVKLLLGEGRVDLNSRDEVDFTPLAWSAKGGHGSIVQLLLAEDRLDLNSKVGCGDTPLMWAIAHGDEVVKLFLANDGVDINSKNARGCTALLLAAQFGRHAAVRLLLAKPGIDLNLMNIKGETALLVAAKYGYYRVVKLLLAKGGMNLALKNKYGETALSLAAKSGRDAVVKLLLRKGEMKLSSKNNAGETALSQAAKNGHDSVVKLLLAKDGVDVDSESFHGSMALALATQNGHDAVVKLLINHQNSRAKHPKHSSSEEGAAAGFSESSRSEKESHSTGAREGYESAEEQEEDDSDDD
jgi:ankyrin repeat protein